MTEAERLKVILRRHNAEYCPTCHHEIGFGDIAWNNGETGSGTPDATVGIQCVICSTEIVNFHSWYPDIETNDELLHVLEGDWPN